jgi:hypothetical protein
MSIWELDKLLIFILFVIPGFISLKVYELLCPSQSKDSSKQIVDAVAYSCINYAIFIVPIVLINKQYPLEEYPYLHYFVYFAALFLGPIIWAITWHSVRKVKFLQKIIPHPTQKPWDYVFSKRKSYWIVVRLKDGTKVAGLYHSDSFSSSNPANEQIYLEESWILNDDGGFERPVNGTAGVIVLSDIAYVELMADKQKGEDDDGEEKRESE